MTCDSGLLSQSHFEGVWGWHSHSRNRDLGVLRDSWKLRVWLQGSKHLALKVLKFIYQKLHRRVFGHLQHKLWTKEGLGVKLIVWLPTIKSRESTEPWCVQVECNTPSESSQGELQVCFRPHANWRSEQRVMNSQSPESPNWDNFRTPL
jgi:hypothetical protein